MVDAIGTSATTNVVTQPLPRAAFRDVTTAVAKELGVSTDDLTAQLRSGASLDDVAAAKGVSHDQLVATIAGALQGSSQGGATDPTQIQQLAERIATTKGHAAHHHHHHRGVTADEPASGTAPSGAPQAPGSSSAPADAGGTTSTLGTRLDARG